MDVIRDVITHPGFVSVWMVQVVVAIGVLIRDMRTNNPQIMSLMRWVWILTVTYSGLIGLALYFWSGRRQIREDTLYRRACRSVAHCYSGCGAGEVVGVIIAAGLLALDTLWLAVVTFGLAYLFGIALTAGPLLQEGMGRAEAIKDAVVSETASITVMEVVAIGVDIWLAGDSTMGDPLFWMSLIVSLTLGLAAAYPVNVLLLRFGVKEGMMDPREMAHTG